MTVECTDRKCDSHVKTVLYTVLYVTAVSNILGSLTNVSVEVTFVEAWLCPRGAYPPNLLCHTYSVESTLVCEM